jgi:hypothetical protein
VKWRQRFRTSRLEGLADEPRPGAPEPSVMPKWKARSPAPRNRIHPRPPTGVPRSMARASSLGGRAQKLDEAAMGKLRGCFGRGSQKGRLPKTRNLDPGDNQICRKIGRDQG